MAVLSDHEIKELCTAPKFMVTLKQQKPVENGVVSLPTFIKMGSNETLENLTQGVKSKIIESFQPITEEDILKYPVMISPFVDHQVRYRVNTVNPELNVERFDEELDVTVKDQRIVSYGLSSQGYDFRVANEFKIFTNKNNVVIDPLNFDESCFETFIGDACIVPPNSFVLARTVEKFRMPENVIGICVGKSTLARCGLEILVTPLECGWEGYLTLEYANVTSSPILLHANMGGGQIVFHLGNKPEVTYADRKGKYHHQGAEVVTARV